MIMKLKDKIFIPFKLTSGTKVVITISLSKIKIVLI